MIDVRVDEILGTAVAKSGSVNICTTTKPWNTVAVYKTTSTVNARREEGDSPKNISDELFKLIV